MRLHLRYEKRHILAEGMICDEVSVDQGLVRHWRNRLHEDCLLDIVALVSVAVCSNHGILHGRLRDGADEVVWHGGIVVRLQGQRIVVT